MVTAITVQMQYIWKDFFLDILLKKMRENGRFRSIFNEKMDEEIMVGWKKRDEEVDLCEFS